MENEIWEAAHGGKKVVERRRRRKRSEKCASPDSERNEKEGKRKESLWILKLDG